MPLTGKGVEPPVQLLGYLLEGSRFEYSSQDDFLVVVVVVAVVVRRRR